MRKPFNPSEYQTYSDLPVTKKEEFRQIDETGNFVSRYAELDPDKAHEEANKITLAETGDITYKQGDEYRGSEYNLDIIVNGEEETIWLKDKVRRAMETKLLTAAVREAIKQTKPQYIEVIENDNCRPAYRISSDDMEDWAGRAALKLHEIKEAQKNERSNKKRMAEDGVRIKTTSVRHYGDNDPCTQATKPSKEELRIKFLNDRRGPGGTSTSDSFDL